MSFLELIIADRRENQPRTIDGRRLEQMLAKCGQLPPVRSLVAALASRPAVIAEIKRHSPSQQSFPGFRAPPDLARAYEQAGAAAVSVLTNEKFFGMRKSDLSDVATAVRIPVLRKEFLISEYDVLESRLLGADAILLIVNILDDVTLATLAGLARQIGLEVLFEIHDESELERVLAIDPHLIGVNARNLDTLQLDLAAARELAVRIPTGISVVAESGIAKRRDMEMFMREGVSSFLIGTQLLLDESPERRLAELLTRESEIGTR